MPKKSALDWLAEERRADVSLFGNRADERFDDEALAELGGWPIHKAHLAGQHMSRVPPFQPALKALTIRGASLKSIAGIERLAALQTLELIDLPELASVDGIEALGALTVLDLRMLPALGSIAGIERLTSLQTLDLVRLPALDVEDTFARLAELPELTRLRLRAGMADKLPRSIAELPSLVDITLEVERHIDLTETFEILGALPTLRNVRIVGGATIPDTLESLARIEMLVVGSGGGMFPPSVGALSNLVTLDLERARYDALPPTIGKLTRLTNLILKNTSIAVLPDELCECLALERLDADDTLLAALPEQIGRLAKLRYLHVDSPKLKSLPRSIGQLAELRELKIPFKGKVQLPDELFDLRLERFIGPFEISEKLTLRPPPTPETNLVRLYDAKRIPADFGDPVQLELLVSEHTAPLPQLSRLRRLKILKVSNIDLADAFPRLVTAPHLRSVAIFGTHRTLPDSLGELAQIRDLAIDGEYGTNTAGVLASLPDAIGALTNLTHLTIGRHAMTRLTDAIGALRCLEELVLHTHDLVELPDALGTLPALKSLTIASMWRLQRLPTSLAGCTALQTLVIKAGMGTDPAIENLDVIGTLPALARLELTNLRRASIDGALERIVEVGTLEELNLDGSNVTVLPASIGKLQKLQTLNLEGTEVTHLPESLRECAALRTIVVPHTLDESVRTNIKTYLPKGKWKTTKRAPSWYTRSG